MLKYKFNLKDISLADFKVYLVAMFKAVFPKSKLRNLDDLKKFIQQKQIYKNLSKIIFFPGVPPLPNL